MKKFTKNNEEFTCINCHELVPKHPTSSRDHCIHCLYSLHIDINPGDRMSKCLGEMIPIGIENTNNRERIVYECNKCNKIHKNIVAPDDNRDLIINLYQKNW